MADPMCPIKKMAKAFMDAEDDAMNAEFGPYARALRTERAMRAALRALAEMEPTEKMERCADAEMAEPHAFGWAVARAAIRAALKEQG